MELDLDTCSIIGIACCGIYYALDNFNNFINKAEHYLKNYQSGKIEFPFTDLVVNLYFNYGNACYNVKAVPISSNNEFAIISGNSCSVFKIIEKGEKHFHLNWNGQHYTIDMEKVSQTFHLTINVTNKVSIEKIDYYHSDSAPIAFPSNQNNQSDESNFVLERCLSELNRILIGYNLPDPILTTNLHCQLDQLFTILRNPLLPSLQFQRFLDDAGALLPSTVVSDLQQIIGQYTLNFSSLISRFPSDKVQSLLDQLLDGCQDDADRQGMSTIVRSLADMAEMFSGGIRGHAKCVMDRLLLDYVRVEEKFQDEDTVEDCNVINHQLDMADIISHNNLVAKNKFILILIEFLERYLPGTISDLKTTIQTLLCCLSGNGYSQLISKLREVLITGQIPSYEVRKNEMEAIFLNSINGYNTVPHTTRLEDLICSNSEVFDLISDFFYHKSIAIRKCAMEVYVRRAYMIYDIYSFEHTQLPSEHLCVLFKFSLPTNSNGRNVMGHELKRSNSTVAIIHRNAMIQRKYSHTFHTQTALPSLEKEDISDGELPNEDNFETEFIRQRSTDNDTDSAISVEANSLSELSATVDSDGVTESSGTKPRHSPSIHSLDRYLAISSNHSSTTKEAARCMKMSNDSLDQCASYSRLNRHASMFCSNPPTSQGQDYSANCDLGFMVIFDTLDEIVKNLTSIQSLLTCSSSTSDSLAYLDYDISSTDKDVLSPSKVILKLILRDPHLMSKCDDEVSGILCAFCDKYLSFFTDVRVERVTYLLQASDKTIRYFTFRIRDLFKEDMKLRNIDPTLSFQLEITRLRNYHLERLPVPNRMMYVYFGTCKEMNIPITAPYRMFTRCIIHHKDFHSSITNVKYMAKEAERNLTEAMDAFDMVWVDGRANQTKSNHIFFYFHSILCINKIDELEMVVREIIFRHGRRLWSLRITQAELKMTVKVGQQVPIPIRLWVHNEGGKSLDICIYREEGQFRAEHKILVSWSSEKEGRYHGVPVDCFYSI